MSVISTNDTKEAQKVKAYDSTGDKLKDALEQLSDKRGATRLAGVTTLSEVFSLNFQASFDFIAKQPDTITATLLAAAKKGDAAAAPAVRALSLAAVVLGDEGSSRILVESSPTLAVLAKDTSKNEDTRVAAVATAGLLCFLGSGEGAEEATWLGILTDLIDAGRKDDDASLTAEALDSFGLIASGMSSTRLCSAAFARHLSSWSLLLAHPSLDVRSSAGENLALVFAALLARAAEGGEPLSEEQSTILEHTAQAMEEQVTDTSHRKAKATKKKQRALFREILGTIKDSETVEETIKVGKAKLLFSGWPKLKQLNGLRSVLGSGLLTHLAENPLLMGLFASGEEGDDKPTRTDKKLSSLATQKERSRKSQLQNMVEED